MQKPNGYDEQQVSGNFVPVELGGHHAGILEVTEMQSSTGKPMIVVKLDFAKNDSQAHYFSNMFKEDKREDKKWPFNGMQYILTEDNDGKCSRNFKAFITSFEKSNNTQVKWDDSFCSQFKNKKIGVVYGEVEEEYNGEVKTRRRIRWFCEDSKVGEQKVPARKNLSTSSTPISKSSNNFVDVPEGLEDEIPL